MEPLAGFGGNFDGLSDSFIEILSLVEAGVMAVVIGSARLLGIALVFPLFSWTNLTGFLRNAFAFTISIPVIVFVFIDLRAMDTIDMGLVTTSIIKELVIGAFLGLVFSLPFYAAQAAGDFIDMTRGASNANIFDPLRAAEATPSGALFIGTSLAVFIAGDGVLMLCDLIYQSYRVVPPLGMLPSVPEIDYLRAFGDAAAALLGLAIILSGPVILALTVTDLILIFANQAARQLNVYDLSPTFKSLVTVAMMPLYMFFFLQYFEGEWLRGLNLMRDVMGLVP